MKQKKLEAVIKGDYAKDKNKYLYKDELIICKRKGSVVELKDGKVFIHADFTGIDKIFFEIKDNKLIISNIFKDFISNEINKDFMEFQKLKGYVPYPFTLLTNVMKAPPGLITCFDMKNKGKITFDYQKSKDLEIFNKREGFDNKKFKGEFTRLLLSNASKEKELISSFSGGFDSLFLTHIYKEKISRMLHFSEDDKIDINYFQALFPDKKWIIVGSDEPFFEEDRKRYFESADEPCCDPAGFAEYIMMKTLSSKIKDTPVMNGQSSDAIFANGRKYFQEHISSKLPDYLRDLSVLKENKENSWFMSKAYSYSLGTRKRFEQFYISDYEFGKEYDSEIQRINSKYEKFIKNDSANYLAAVNMLLKYSVYEIEKIKTVARCFHIKYYLPFMSEDVIRYAFSIPSSQKVGFKIGKKILRKNYKEIEKVKFLSRDFKPQLLKERLIGEKLTEEKYKEYYLKNWIKYNLERK